MKLFVSFLIFIMWASYVQADPNTSPSKKARVARSLATTENSQEKSVISYFKCFEIHKTEMELKKCVDTSLSSKLTASQKDRFYSWLIVFDARLNSFDKCSSRKLKEISFFPEATAHFICGYIDLGTIRKEAVFFFKKDKEKDKIWSIYY